VAHSSRAKKLEAASRISFARFSSPTSRSSSRSRFASPVVVPAAWPASTAACSHQPRNVSGPTPTRYPIRITAAVNDNPGSSCLASTTIRCARSRSSSGYFLGAGINSTLSWVQSPHPTRGRFTVTI